MIKKYIKFFIFLPLIFSCLHAKVVVENKYCINGKNINLSDIVKNTKKDILLFKMPYRATSFKIPTIKLVSKLNELNITNFDNTSGVIEFKKYCNTDKLLKNEKNALKKYFAKKYKNIDILSLHVMPKSTLNDDFSNLTLQQINNVRMHKNKGSFVALYKNKKNMHKNIYFTFDIKANIKAYKAIRKIPNHSLLDTKFYEQVMIEIENIPKNPIQTIKSNTLIAKFDIKKGTILTTKQFNKKTLIRKGDVLQSYFKDKNLILQTQAQALENGNLGDVIKIRTNDGKIFDALIKAKKVVKIR